MTKLANLVFGAAVLAILSLIVYGLLGTSPEFQRTFALKMLTLAVGMSFAASAARFWKAEKYQWMALSIFCSGWMLLTAVK